MTEPKWFDMTISKEKWGKMETLKDALNLVCERFVIGEEVGQGGYEHYQVRAVMKQPTSIEEMKARWGPFGHVSATHVRDFKYCEKEGKFYRSWEEALNKYAMIKLLPWQEKVMDYYTNQTDRQVVVIVDFVGNHGKSWLAKHMHVTRRGRYAPVMDNAQDLIAYAMACPSNGYIFDLPRSESLKKKKEIWSAIETIKNGHLYDKRYNYRETWIDPPKLLIFANEYPPRERLSEDRWKIYQIQEYLNGFVDVFWCPAIEGGVEE